MLDVKQLSTAISEQTRAFSDVMNAQVSFARQVFESQQAIINNTTSELSKADFKNPTKSVESFVDFLSEHHQDYLDAAQKVQEALVAWNDVSWKHTESFVAAQVTALNKVGQKDVAKVIEQIQENIVDSKTQVEAGKKIVEEVVSKQVEASKTAVKSAVAKVVASTKRATTRK